MTLEITDPKATLAELRQRLVEARAFLDIDTKEKEHDELRQRASAPDLWDDPDEARTVSQRLARYENLFDMVARLTSKIDDAEVLLQHRRNLRIDRRGGVMVEVDARHFGLETPMYHQDQPKP